MSTLTAFQFAKTVVVAAYDAEQALGILHSDPDYRIFTLDNARPCTAVELDEPQTNTNQEPSPTMRQRLDHVSEPCWLQDWDGCCPELPASIWATID